MKTILSTTLLLFLTLFLSACDSKTSEVKVVEGNVESFGPPKFTLNTTEGETITLAVSSQTIFSKELENKIVLVNFWAPWCEPCKKEMPSFVKLQEKYKNDFIILGVLFDKKTSTEELANFMKEYNMNFPVTVGEENFKLAKVFGNVTMIPESFLYTKDGIFIEKFVGEISERKLEKYIKDNI
jgi:thiol-disulfide isomerase/thioredoxin